MRAVIPLVVLGWALRNGLRYNAPFPFTILVICHIALVLRVETLLFPVSDSYLALYALPALLVVMASVACAAYLAGEQAADGAFHSISFIIPAWMCWKTAEMAFAVVPVELAFSLGQGLGLCMAASMVLVTERPGLLRVLGIGWLARGVYSMAYVGGLGDAYPFWSSLNEWLPAAITTVTFAAAARSLQKEGPLINS